MPGTSIKLYKQIKFIFISFNLLIPKFSVFGGYLLYSEKFINYNDWNASYLNGDLYINYTAVPQHSTYVMSAFLSLIPITLNFNTLVLFVWKKLLVRKI